MSGKKSNSKGKLGERSLAKFISDAGFSARRGAQQGNSGDAVESPDVKAVLPLPHHIECKRVEKLNLDKAIDQSVRDSAEGEIPCVMHRKNRKEWMVTLRLSDYLNILCLLDKESPCTAVCNINIERAKDS